MKLTDEQGEEILKLYEIGLDLSYHGALITEDAYAIVERLGKILGTTVGEDIFTGEPVIEYKE